MGPLLPDPLANHIAIGALELRKAQQDMGEVVGDDTSDELLAQIFGNFCIGK